MYNLRSSLGYVPQDGYLFLERFRDNICFSKSEKNNSETIELQKAKLYSEIKKFKQGFDTLIGERGVKLSGGKAKITYCSCFYKNPEIFIFDEMFIFCRCC